MYGYIMCYLFNNIMRMYVYKIERCIYIVYVYSKLMYFEVVLYKFIEDLFNLVLILLLFGINK